MVTVAMTTMTTAMVCEDNREDSVDDDDDDDANDDCTMSYFQRKQLQLLALSAAVFFARFGLSFAPLSSDTVHNHYYFYTTKHTITKSAPAQARTHAPQPNQSGRPFSCHSSAFISPLSLWLIFFLQ